MKKSSDFNRDSNQHDLNQSTLVQGSFAMMLSLQASTSSSAVPDCYSCFEKYRYILFLFIHLSFNFLLTGRELNFGPVEAAIRCAATATTECQTKLVEYAGGPSLVELRIWKR